MNADLQAVWPLSAIVGTQTSPLVAILNPAIQVNITLKVIVTIKEFIETMGSQKKTSLTDSKKQDWTIQKGKLVRFTMICCLCFIQQIEQIKTKGIDRSSLWIPFKDI